MAKINLLGFFWVCAIRSKKQRAKPRKTDLGAQMSYLLFLNCYTAGISFLLLKGPANLLQHHPTLLNPTLLDGVAQC